jgi:uncharacterized membrane protein
MWRSFAHRRALAKTVSWRGLSFIVTTLGVWLLTGKPTLAASVGLAEIAFKFVGYYVHECVWESIDPSTFAGFPFSARSISKNFQEEKQQCQQLS